jgi:hypothetical protein
MPTNLEDLVTTGQAACEIYGTSVVTFWRHLTKAKKQGHWTPTPIHFGNSVLYRRDEVLCFATARR